MSSSNPLHSDRSVSAPVTNPETMPANVQILESGWRVLLTHNVVRPLDIQLSRLCARWEHQIPVLLAVALTSQELGRGHVCFQLRHWRQRLLVWASIWQEFLPECFHLIQPWLQVSSHPTLLHLLRQSSLIQVDDTPLQIRPDADKTTAETIGQCPLTLFGERLYLTRYFHFEQQVAAWLNRQAEVPLMALTPAGQTLFSALFPQGENGRDALNSHPEGSMSSSQPEPAHPLVDWQALAALTASMQQFTLISGGPGTGKTTTVTKLLALLVANAQDPAAGGSASAPVIRLAAPTGKAAARLTESIVGAKARLLADGVDARLLEAIPAEARTLHRLLGVRRGSPDFYHDEQNPLLLDVLVVDEASMIDLPMMARLLRALPAHARLILLGDRDQLASVEAGAVLGDICQMLQQGISPTLAASLESLAGVSLKDWVQAQGHPLRDHLCLLRKSWRFDAHSGIGRLARAVNEGLVREALAVLADVSVAHRTGSEAPDLLWFADENRLQVLVQRAAAGYAAYLSLLDQRMDTARADALLAAFNQTRVLCAVHEGPWGVTGLNAAIAKQLWGRVFVEGEWFAGRPVMITQNDYDLGLYNGDIGITASDGERLRVWFRIDGEIRGVYPSRLSAHETAWAMTVHKSQGSEFNHTLLVLPPVFQPLLTRELLYTGITRARARLDLYCDEAVLRQSIQKRTERHSGLLAMLGLEMEGSVSS